LASIYKIFENKTASKFDVQEVVQSRESIIESLCNAVSKKPDTDENLLEYYKQQSEDIRLLAYKLLLEGINTKYKDFDDSQKKLIREYILNVSNTNSLSNYVCEEIEKIKQIIVNSKNKITDNQVIAIKLSEITNVLDKVKPTTVVKDNHIMALLLSYELVKELNNLK
jgi:predicted metal-dependent hydrolase